MTNILSRVTCVSDLKGWKVKMFEICQNRKPQITKIMLILIRLNKTDVSLLNRIRVMMLNATFNNISVISWQSVLQLVETAVPGENHQPAASH